MDYPDDWEERPRDTKIDEAKDVLLRELFVNDPRKCFTRVKLK